MLIKDVAKNSFNIHPFVNESLDLLHEEQVEEIEALSLFSNVGQTCDRKDLLHPLLMNEIDVQYVQIVVLPWLSNS